MTGMPPVPAKMQDGVRDVQRWGRPVFFYKSQRDFFRRPQTPSGIHSIKELGVFFDFYIENRNTECVTVNFHPAVEGRKDKKLPIFVGKGISSKTHSVVMVSDPTLYFDRTVPCTWFSGAKDSPVQDLMVVFLRDIFRKLGARRIIFTGVSGGGFASLLFAQFFPGSLAVVVNPVTKLGLTSLGSFNQWMQVCFPGQNIDDVLAADMISDLRQSYAAGFSSRIFYMQNATDAFVAKHAMPFLNGIQDGDRDKIKVLMGEEWGKGHVAPPADFLREVLAIAAESHSADEALTQLPGALLSRMELVES